MTKILMLSFSLLVSAPCFAHLELGEYRGTTGDGKTCDFKVVKIEFETGYAHPLNERVQIDIHGKSFTLRHLPSVNAELGRVQLDRDHLTSVEGADYGVLVASLGMDHSEGHHGPTALSIIVAKDSVSQRNVCDHLVHQD